MQIFGGNQEKMSNCRRRAAEFLSQWQQRRKKKIILWVTKNVGNVHDFQMSSAMQNQLRYLDTAENELYNVFQIRRPKR